MSLFPFSLLVIYGVLFGVMSDKASMALRSSLTLFLNILLPLCLVFILILFMNLFLKPAQIATFLGKGSGIMGIILATASGIVSMGPIYAWYPLLKDLREKGVGNALIAIFLGNRAVKPFLLPVLISYFGWTYTLILTILTIFGSLAVGYFVGTLVKDEAHFSGHM